MNDSWESEHRDPAAPPVIDRSTRMSMYADMWRARVFEERAYDLFLQGLVKGTTHLGTGQEAVAAGFANAMRHDDMTFCTYRGHNHTLLRGASMDSLMGELLGRELGCCDGKGGSIYALDLVVRMRGSRRSAYQLLERRRGVIELFATPGTAPPDE